jgi:hypothetical protein
MPVVPYYQGRPARTWIAAISGHRPAQQTAASAPAPASLARQTPLASPRPTAPPVQQRTHQEVRTSMVTTAASPWSTWASHWFTPHGRSWPAHDSGQRSAAKRFRLSRSSMD